MEVSGEQADIDLPDANLGSAPPAALSAAEPPRILVVDDDQRLCRLLVRVLSGDGFVVECAHDGTGMWHMLNARSPSLVILDLRLPGAEDGLTLARRLRENSDIPLIMLTGRTDSMDKVLGLDTGADDYITKPFDNLELLARIRCVLRRAGGRTTRPLRSQQASGSLHFAGWQFDTQRREVTSDAGYRLSLTGYEHELLMALVRNQGRVLCRDQICELVANRHWRPDDRSIDVLVAKLRRKLGDEPRNPRLIKTIRGRGYVFTAPVTHF